MLLLIVASATATRYGLSRGLLGLEYDRINISDSDSERSACKTAFDTLTKETISQQCRTAMIKKRHGPFLTESTEILKTHRHKL